MPWNRLSKLLSIYILLAILVGCASRPGGGGYYKDDGPGSNIPADIASIPDAIPRIETHASANFRPYEIFGQRYVPIQENQPYRQVGVASWYGRKFHGQKTANGEIYDMYAMTAAHPTLPIPSYARIIRATTGKTIIVRVNDRGPFHSSRIIDLSYAAAAKLGLIGPGSGAVIVEAITNDDIRNGRVPRTAAAPGVQTMAVALPISDAQPATPMASQPPAPREDPPPRVQTALFTPGSGGIFLQFGAFSSSYNAQTLAQRINQQSGGMAGTASVHNLNNLYKVRIGPFSSRTEAVNAAFSLHESTGLTAAIASD